MHVVNLPGFLEARKAYRYSQLSSWLDKDNVFSIQSLTGTLTIN